MMTPWILAAACLFIQTTSAEDLTVSGYYPPTLGIYPNLTTTDAASLARRAGEGVAIGHEIPEANTSLHLRAAIPRWRLQSTLPASLGSFEFRVYDTAGAFKALAIRDVEANADRLVIDSRGFLGIGMEPAGPLSSASGLSIVGTVRSEVQFLPNPPSARVNSYFMGTRGGDFTIRAEGTANQGLVMTSDGRFYLGDGVTPIGVPVAANRKIDTDTGGYLQLAPPKWVNASSRRLKTDVRPLSQDRAAATLGGLEPVSYFYKHSGNRSLGFIAEDVPELVAEPGRGGLSPLEIIAVLTKAAQEQQREIEELEKIIKERKP